MLVEAVFWLDEMMRIVGKMVVKCRKMGEGNMNEGSTMAEAEAMMVVKGSNR